MICLNCGKEVPDKARSCKHCESKIDHDFPLKVEDLQKILLESGLTPEMLEEMGHEARKHNSAQEYANAIFVGTCPKCGSENVSDCDEMDGVEDVTVGRCFDCGLFWCTECGYQLKKGEKHCPHWTACDGCKEEEDCPHIVDTTQCPRVRKWMQSMGLPLTDFTIDED